MLKRYFFWVPVFLFLAAEVSGQIGGIGKDLGRNRGVFRPKAINDTAGVKNKTTAKKIKQYPLELYKYSAYSNPKDSLVIDTVLDIRDYYRANFAQTDLFEYMPFQNIGQPVNRLDGYFFDLPFEPQFVPTGKIPFARTEEEIFFYHVPTPYSRLFFLTGNNQGQMLDSRLGVNILPNWNLALGYRGLSSLGYYRRSLALQESWFFNTEYAYQPWRYKTRFYIFKNHLENEESGGITDEDLFENQSDTYADRGRIPVRLDNDKSIYHNRKLRWENQWQPFENPENLSIVYDFTYDKGYYEYHGGTQDFYGNTIAYSLDKDSIAHRDYVHAFSLQYKSGTFESRLGWKHRRMFIGFDTTVAVNAQIIPRLNLYTFNYLESVSYYDFGPVKNKTQILFEPGKSLYSVRHHTGFSNKKWKGDVSLLLQKRWPRPVFWIWQSRFERYNWKKSPVPVKESLLTLRLMHAKWGELKIKSLVQYNRPYLDSLGVSHQYPGKTQVMKAYYGKDWQLGKWGFYPEVQWQKVLAGNQILDLPQWNTRAAFYYQDWWFTHHMWLQTGVEFRYFSPFYMSGYIPLLNEFYEQREKKYGGFYLLDFFFNFKVKKFRAFLKLAHFNAYWEKKKPRYYSAPGYPYADNYIRLGIIWEFTN